MSVVQGRHAHLVWVGDGARIVGFGIFDDVERKCVVRLGGRIQGAQDAVTDIAGRDPVAVGPVDVATQGEGVDGAVGRDGPGYLDC